MRKSGDGDEFRGEIERDAHQGSNIADALSRRAPQEGVGEKEGADEGSRKREHSTVDEDKEHALDDASESGKMTQDRRRQPPLGVIRTLCREAAECRFLHRSKGLFFFMLPLLPTPPQINAVKKSISVWVCLSKCRKFGKKLNISSHLISSWFSEMKCCILNFYPAPPRISIAADMLY